MDATQDGRGRVLVVDDEQDLRDLLHRELRAAGHEVAVAQDGVAALVELGYGDYDVVVSDVRMPRLDGMSLLREVKERAPSTEVVITTGYASLDTAVECVRLGAFDLLQKPVDLLALTGATARAVERRRLRDETALHRASRAIFEARRAERLPEAISAIARGLLPADAVALFLGGDAGLHLAHLDAAPGVAAAPLADAAAECAGHGALVRDLPAAHGAPAISIVAHPLGEGASGVLVAARTAGRFRATDATRLGILAAQVHLALENARLVRQTLATDRLVTMGRLAACVAHEIRGPLSYVSSNLAELARGLGALRERGAPADAVVSLEQALADAREGTARIAEIAQDVRGLGRSAEDAAEVDVERVVRSALRIAGPELKARARLALRLAPGAMVVGSPGRLSQVVLNLVLNALQAMEGRPQDENAIEVESGAGGGRVAIRVRDNGPGIAPAHLARIFEPFFTTKAEGEGTGLGLAICRDIARAHGGDISVETRVGEGTTFTLTLPAAAARADAA
jgi:signal transduction histidine kinase